MTTAADDTADEAAFEAFLAGRPVPDEPDGGSHAVAAFAGAVRATATLLGRPNAALADLLATGLLTDQSSPSIRTAPSAGRSPRRSRVRRRRRFAMFFPALLAKLLSAGAMAQAASGAGICLVAFTGAGVAGVLPGSVQETFSSVVGTQTAAETTVPADPTGTPIVGDGTGDVAAGTETTHPSDAAGFELDPSQSFGQQINGQVEHGEIDGSKVSDLAHDRNEQRKAGTATPTTAPEAESAEDAHDDGSAGSRTGDAPEVTTESGRHGSGNNGRGHN
jgi:hypothetical protein